MLEIRNVSKRYKNNEKQVLNNVSINIKEGEFVALLGQNGAGKTTLINIIGGNVKKDTGKIFIDGFDIDRDELKTKKLLGIVPQEISFDFLFSVNEILNNQSGYFSIKKNEKYIKEILLNLGLYEKRYSNNRDLSGGMKRRLLIAKALVHKPKLLILDEPTAGVDIELRHSMYRYLKKLHKLGFTIILTTHYLEEAEELCDRIIVINEGNIIIDDSKKNILDTLGNEAFLEFQSDNKFDSKQLSVLSGYSPEIINESILQLKVIKDDIEKVLKKMIENNIQFNNFKLEQKKLEDIYLKLIRS